MRQWIRFSVVIGLIIIVIFIGIKANKTDNKIFAKKMQDRGYTYASEYTTLSNGVVVWRGDYYSVMTLPKATYITVSDVKTAVGARLGGGGGAEMVVSANPTEIMKIIQPTDTVVIAKDTFNGVSIAIAKGGVVYVGNFTDLPGGDNMTMTNSQVVLIVSHSSLTVIIATVVAVLIVLLFGTVWAFSDDSKSKTADHV